MFKNFYIGFAMICIGICFFFKYIYKNNVIVEEFQKHSVSQFSDRKFDPKTVSNI